MKSTTEKDSLAQKIRFYPSNGRQTVKKENKNHAEQKYNSSEGSPAASNTKLPEELPAKTAAPKVASPGLEKEK